MSKKDFFKAFFTSRKVTGSVVPSSRFLTGKMLETVDFGSARCIVELGPGTGVFTKEILKRMQPDAKLLVVELNDTFVDNLKQLIDDPRVVIIHGSAENIGEYIREQGFERADFIISSLPLTTIPQEIRQSILKKAYEFLKEGGQFIQFQYSMHQRKNLKQLYRKLELAYTPLNFPPAFVYRCTK
ncbi:rRNA adenine N-6-methyltransferase family protein [Wandonia haliotis]|uniref:rRNA adenine N-6-methyltransferase family protein n=1 Tax=Wandonia haliotis TaxID=574963 RepID=A0ABP3Y1L7_9FLAO